MLFGMPVTKYVLNNKSFKALERGSFKCLSTFHILQRNNKKMQYKSNKKVFPGCEKEGCYEGYQKLKKVKRHYLDMCNL